MTILKKGDICPLCGEPINTSDPFTLGYLSALADILQPSGGALNAPSDLDRAIEHFEGMVRLSQNRHPHSDLWLWQIALAALRAQQGVVTSP